MLKKVLIITYYWPPAGGIAVQRWVKFSKYLVREGWQPIIYTVSNGHYQQLDESMVKDVSPEVIVIKKPIWEPHRIYQLISGKKDKINTDEISQKKKSLIGKISTWIRSNFFIPDARRFWIKPSVNFLCDYLKEHPVDALVSTGPPHSAHLIAMQVKKKMNLPWLADFRDPWTSMDYYHDLLLTKRADRKHHSMELKVLLQADEITVVGKRMKEEFEAKRQKEVTVVTNGYDEEDFLGVVRPDENVFLLMYVGSFFDRINPVNLWNVLGKLKKENHPLIQQLKIKIMGQVAQGVLNSIQQNDLQSLLEIIPFQPHEVATREMKKASVLLLAVDVRTKFVLTGKLFEYLGAQRPILAFGPPDGDAAAVLTETKAGKMFSFEEEEGVRDYIIKLFQSVNHAVPDAAPRNTQAYAHRTLAGRISFVLNRMTTKPSVN